MEGLIPNLADPSEDFGPVHIDPQSYCVRHRWTTSLHRKRPIHETMAALFGREMAFVSRPSQSETVELVCEDQKTINIGWEHPLKVYDLLLTIRGIKRRIPIWAEPSLHEFVMSGRWIDEKRGFERRIPSALLENIDAIFLFEHPLDRYETIHYANHHPFRKPICVYDLEDPNARAQASRQFWHDTGHLIANHRVLERKHWLSRLLALGEIQNSRSVSLWTNWLQPLTIIASQLDRSPVIFREGEINMNEYWADTISSYMVDPKTFNENHPHQAEVIERIALSGLLMGMQEWETKMFQSVKIRQLIAFGPMLLFNFLGLPAIVYMHPDPTVTDFILLGGLGTLTLTAVPGMIGRFLARPSYKRFLKKS